jgi:hypothetical protein
MSGLFVITPEAVAAAEEPPSADGVAFVRDLSES